ncbi:acetate--CoA ligase [Enteractinococcus coprophilus]|uniref:Acetyl-coenzyme A synthetase n=1 Tax=Enteractinococcus coprophilus TaxID=1027633 RepID=A0A543AFA7_9MICC|nr:acetate--CoA ligase [Enteractinococcus coprophilus]TQL71261.1 acetyl-coenzyme A synthetase [Enteractinococcus coprophilus]
MANNPTIRELSQEDRTFEPPPAFAAQANVTAELYEQAETDRLGFWAEQAKRISWDTDFDDVLDWSDAPFAKWFTDGKLNAAYNCVDRHVEAGLGDRVAYYFEGEGGDTRTITYHDLLREVSKAANALIELGVKTGDRVAIYMPMIPETVFAMLACARIGAPHTVIFGGFSDRAIADRVSDCGVEVVITADGGYRRGKTNPLKATVDQALRDIPEVRTVVVVKRTGEDIDWHDDRDVWWHDVVDKQPETHEPEFFDAEHPLYIMYSSGTTGKPKGIMHTTGGYLVGVAYTHWAVFDIKPETDIYWTAADIGWVTGHSYIVYGPLVNATTSVLYEGTPDTPHRGRWWEIVQKYGVTILYCAPTSIRTFMRWGRDIPADYDLSSLRLLGSVGEPINPEAWMWYREHIGGNNCPIVDTWWQTENGHILISPLPGVTATKPGATMRALPGITADIYDEAGTPVEPGNGGYLVITEPWPGMLRTLWGDEERYKKTYWSQYPGVYFSGDGAKFDKDGDIWVLGRVDDVLNVSGHRMSTAEIESALVAHAMVAEAAVVGAQDETTGQAIEAFVILRESAKEQDNAVGVLRAHVRAAIGPIATPRSITVVTDLPKTRSGKIMRRLLKDLAEDREIGDTTTLADASVMETIQQQVRAARGS